MDGIAIEDINCMVYDQEKLYMISPHIPIIMVYEFEKKRVEKICNYPHGVEELGAFEKMIKHNSKLYLFPCRADSIYYYDMEMQTYTKLLALDSVGVNFPDRKFFEVCLHRGLIYAVCRFPNLIICINPISDDIQIWQMNQKIVVSDKIVFVDFSVCVIDNKLLYPYGSDIIIEFNIDNEKFQVMYLTRMEEEYDEKYRCLIGMTIDDAEMQWVYDWYGSVYKISDSKMIKINMPPGFEGVYNDGMYEEGTKISDVLPGMGRLYFILNSDHRLLVYDIQGNSFSWIDNMLAVQDEVRRNLAYTTYTKMNKDQFLLYDYNDRNIYVLNLQKGFKNQIELYLSGNDVTNDDYMREYWRKNLITRDDLNTYIQIVWKSNNDKGKKNENRIGEKVHSVVINNV